MTIRINKATARKLFSEGKEIWLTACNMRPEYGILLNSGYYNDLGRDFDKIVNAFQYYNCNNECGRYPAYYVEGESLR